MKNYFVQNSASCENLMRVILNGCCVRVFVALQQSHRAKPKQRRRQREGEREVEVEREREKEGGRLPLPL